MPAPPELGDALGDVGVVKVLQKVEPEHAAQANGHVRIGREIKVDLEGMGQGSYSG